MSKSRTDVRDWPVAPGCPGAWDRRSEQALAAALPAPRTSREARPAPRPEPKAADATREEEA
ncbi:hypothetical protein [Streptomyces sp. Da 82-17]|uniref:hypothetical protein n=1 Tax=Streptomyces sp. Da 82-17 TaxID=3377116 RepID=UPI0038D4FB3F